MASMELLLGKIEQVRSLFRELDVAQAAFRMAAGLRCPSGCGNCCKTATLCAAPLEFYPAAYELWLSGRLVSVMEQALAGGAAGSVCAFFAALPNGGGACSFYAHRGLVCRLFGYAANYDKHGRQRLIACRILKESDAGQTLTPEALAVLEPPIVVDWYARLADIDPAQAEIMPMADALAVACQTVDRTFGDCPPQIPSPVRPAA